MLIAHVTFEVDQTNSSKALDALTAEAAQVRAMTGCIAFNPFQDATNPALIGVLHEWETPEDFAGYTASQEFARAGATLRPMMVKPPLSRRFDASLIESV